MYFTTGVCNCIPVLELVHQYSALYLSANCSAFFSISPLSQSDWVEGKKKSIAEILYDMNRMTSVHLVSTSLFGFSVIEGLQSTSIYHYYFYFISTKFNAAFKYYPTVYTGRTINENEQPSNALAEGEITSVRDTMSRIMEYCTHNKISFRCYEKHLKVGHVAMLPCLHQPLPGRRKKR